MATSGGDESAPRTYIGRWLRATMLRQHHERDQLVHLLNGGTNGWNDDEPAVVEAALELMASRYFGPSPQDNDVTDTARFVGEATTDSDRDIKPAQAEAVISAALAGNEAVPAAIRRAETYLARVSVIAFMAMKSRMSEHDVSELLRDAEALAFERGWHPPLAPNGVDIRN
jgi:hypothetical protein